MKVKVYLEFINAWGEVIDSQLIATFRNRTWADSFIHEICSTFDDDNFTRIRVEGS